MRTSHLSIIISSLLIAIPSSAFATSYSPLDNASNARTMVSRHASGSVDTDPYRHIGFSGLNTLNGLAYRYSKETADTLIQNDIVTTFNSYNSAYAGFKNTETDDIDDLVGSYSSVVGTDNINNALYLNTYKAILDNSYSRHENALKGAFSSSRWQSSYNQTHTYREIILGKSKTGVNNVTNEYQSIYDTRKGDLHDLMEDGYNKYQSKYSIAQQAITAASRYTDCTRCGAPANPVAMKSIIDVKKIDLDDIKNEYCTSYTFSGTNGIDKIAQTITTNCI